jgi:hypothetical protein
MSEPDILFPAIFVFTMLLIGLALTIWEFSRLQKAARAVAVENKPGKEQEPGRNRARIMKASGF